MTDKRRWASNKIDGAFSVLCTLYSVLCTLYSVLCVLCSVFCVLCSVLCALYSALCTLYSFLSAPRRSIICMFLLESCHFVKNIPSDTLTTARGTHIIDAVRMLLGCSPVFCFYPHFLKRNLGQEAGCHAPVVYHARGRQKVSAGHRPA